MSRMIVARSVAFFLLACSVICAPSMAAQERSVMDGSRLLPGFDMGVNSSGGRTDWLTNHDGYMEMSYPTGQLWGAVFVTVGKPQAPPRPMRDLSEFDTLTIDMRGRAGGEQLEIGIKTNTQPDDGSETKASVKLTSDWHTYEFPLSEFAATDPRHLYVVTEFVFAGAQPRTVYFRDIRYRQSAHPRQTGNGAATASPMSSGQLTGATPCDGGGSAPSVTITYPATGHTVKIWSGTRPSLLVQGGAEGIPSGYRLYLAVHPTTSDQVWTQEIPARRNWLGQVYFGDTRYKPKDGESFELVAILANRSPPENFSELNDTFAYHVSNMVTVDVSVRSWIDRAGAFAKDYGVSVPIAALLTSAGGILGAILKSRAANKNGKSRAEDA